MAGSHSDSLPIALRREPRRCVSAAARLAQPRADPVPVPTILKTPSKPRSQKRVRFSDLGPEPSRYEEASSTGLTPMVKRSSLGEPSPKRRRDSAATTARRRASTGDLGVDPEPTRKGKGAKTRTGRQNKATKAKVEAEVQHLRAELANRDAEIERLHIETLAYDADRIIELERQIEGLRTELAQRQLPRISIEADDDDVGDETDDDDGVDLPAHSFYDWTLAARTPCSESNLEDDHDDDRDITMTDVMCSTPTRPRKTFNITPVKSASASFPTPPCTSPTLPGTPCSARGTVEPVTPHYDISTQASLPDPEKEALEAELVSLRLELTKLTTTLENHTSLQSRLSEALLSADPPSPDEEGSKRKQLELDEHLNAVLAKLSERSEALSEISASLSTLGFAGSNASEVVGTITSAFRTARLELEYLTPGEITLPLWSHCAEVLDLMLVRLRDLGHRLSEADDTIDEYHAIELSLRQQLAARVDAMSKLRGEQETDARALRARDEHIADLEVGLDRLKGAAAGYRRDMAELEALVQRLEDGGKVAEAKLRADLEGAQAQLADRVAVISELEGKLADTLQQTDALETKLADAQRRREAEAKVRNQSYGAALALRDARVMELRREIYEINEGLRSAHDTIMTLRVEKAGLEKRAEKAEEGTRLAREAVEAMKAELEKVTAAAAEPPRRVTRSSAKMLATPEPQPGAFLSGGLARSGSGKGKKRRKFDSGVGMDEDELDLS